MARAASSGARELISPRAGLARLREAARECTACPLYRDATQTVFGEGPATARMILVGEQPGDQEDRIGHPFVGPAGRVLDDALDRAKIARRTVYVTNTVKHFKFEPRGKRRIHKRPSSSETAACRPWLEAEIARIHPDVVVAMGATAAQSLLGPKARVTEIRGIPQDSPFGPVVATMHPSSVLRQQDSQSRRDALGLLADDLASSARLLRVSASRG